MRRLELTGQGASVGPTTSHNLASYITPKTNTQLHSFEFPLQIRSGETMKVLIDRNRADARATLELAIAVTEVCMRHARSAEHHNYDAGFLAQLKRQREPEISTRHVRIGGVR